MNSLATNQQTRQQIEAYMDMPGQVLLLVGPPGSGKFSLARDLAESILGLRPSRLETHPYYMHLSVQPDRKLIAIEAVRDLIHFLTLKVPSEARFNRAIIIERAHLLSHQAQNALLKTLEEPPSGTLIVLTVDYEQALLPTVRSRAQIIYVKRPLKEDLVDYFTEMKIEKAKIDKAYAISGGLPGLMRALLSEEDHPLLAATEKARQLLSRTNYERLLLVDELAKQPALASDTLFILQQMSHISLQSTSGASANKWQKVLSASYAASEELLASGQPKLVLTKLMLSL